MVDMRIIIYHNENECPFCQSDNIAEISRHYNATKDGGGMGEFNQCNDCQEIWEFVYQLAGWRQ